MISVEHPKNKRNYGIDLIKILGILFVPSLHFFLNYGFYTGPLNDLMKVPQEAIRWISMTCIGLFLMSTGYLQYGKYPSRSHYVGILKYLLTFLMYSIITALYINGTQQIIKTTLAYFLQTPSYFWYMGCFIGLYCIFPYFNLLVDSIGKKEYQLLIAVLVACISVPEFLNGIPALYFNEKILFLPKYWTECFPVLYYFLGAYLKKYPLDVKKMHWLTILLGTAFILAGFDYWASGGGQPHCYGGGYAGLPVLIMTFSVFVLFYNFEIKTLWVRRVLKRMSGLTLEIYLGLIVSDTITRKIMESVTDCTLYRFRCWFLEVPLNFLISFIIAIVMKFLMENTIYHGIKRCTGEVYG